MSNRPVVRPGVRRAAPLLLVVPLVALAACSSPAAPGPGTGGPGSSEALLVTPALEGAAAVTRTVLPGEAAVLETTAADGTRYTLSLPADAVPYPVDVTLTPLAGLAGLPAADGLLAGAHFAPDGLELFEPARLDIVPARPSAPAERIPVAYRGAGGAGEASFGLLLDDAAPGALALEVLHFSGVGVALGTAADRAALAASRPGRGDDRAWHELGAARDAHARGATDAAALAAAEAVALRTWHDAVVRPTLDAAEARAAGGAPSDLALLQEAAHTALAWERRRVLRLGEDGMAEEGAAVRAQLVRILETFYAAMRSRCIDDHDVAVITVLLVVEREAQLLGLDLGSSLRDCLQFELTLESTVRLSLDGTEAMRWSVAASAATAGVSNGWDPQGTGRLEYADAYIYDPYDPSVECSGSSFTELRGSDVEVARFHFVPGDPAPGDDSGYRPLRDAVATVVLGEPGETITSACGPVDTTYFLQAYRQLRGDAWWEASVFLEEDWTVLAGGGEELARKTVYDAGPVSLSWGGGTSGPYQGTADTVLTVRHAPRR